MRRANEVWAGGCKFDLQYAFTVYMNITKFHRVFYSR